MIHNISSSPSHHDDDDEMTISTRFFWRNIRDLTGRWRLIYMSRINSDENCNRTVGMRLPGGVLFICLNVPLRQRPCAGCQAMWDALRLDRPPG